MTLYTNTLTLSFRITHKCVVGNVNPPKTLLLMYRLQKLKNSLKKCFTLLVAEMNHKKRIFECFHYSCPPRNVFMS